MTASRKRLKPYLDYLERLGFEVVGIKLAGTGHFKIVVRLDGAEVQQIAPYSPSDRRAILNWKANVKRLRRALDEKQREAFGGT